MYKPGVRGVYIIRNSLDEVIYVGCSKDLNQRMLGHIRDGKEISSVSYIIGHTKRGCLNLEQAFIKQYRPIGNQIGIRCKTGGNNHV